MPGAQRGEELASLSDNEVRARSKAAARREPAAPRAKRREKPAAVPKSGAMPLSVLHRRRASGSDADREPGGAAAARRAVASRRTRRPRAETRRNLDKRTARFRNARHFVGAIAAYRDRHPEPPEPPRRHGRGT